MEALVPDRPWFTLLFVAGVCVFLWWIYRRSKRSVAGYTSREVEVALMDLLSSGSMDEWDLFLSYPIREVYLESIRQRCLRIDKEHHAESDEGRRRVAALLEELKQAERQRTTFNA